MTALLGMHLTHSTLAHSHIQSCQGTCQAIKLITEVDLFAHITCILNKEDAWMSNLYHIATVLWQVSKINEHVSSNNQSTIKHLGFSLGCRTFSPKVPDFWSPLLIIQRPQRPIKTDIATKQILQCKSRRMKKQGGGEGCSISTDNASNNLEEFLPQKTVLWRMRGSHRSLQGIPQMRNAIMVEQLLKIAGHTNFLP